MPDYWFEKVIFEALADNDVYVPDIKMNAVVRQIRSKVRSQAEGRAIKAFVTTSSPLLVEAWNQDAEFHTTIVALARIFVAGVFEETMLTSAEEESRIMMIQKVFDKMAQGWK